MGSPDAKQAFGNVIWEQIFNTPGDWGGMSISHYVSYFLGISRRKCL